MKRTASAVLFCVLIVCHTTSAGGLDFEELTEEVDNFPDKAHKA